MISDRCCGKCKYYQGREDNLLTGVCLFNIAKYVKEEVILPWWVKEKVCVGSLSDHDCKAFKHTTEED